MSTNDPVPSPGESALAENLARERRRVRRLQALLLLALACAGAMATLWRATAAEGRRAAEQALIAERARVEADQLRERAQIAAERLASERDRALADRTAADQARAKAQAVRDQLAALEYARTLQLAAQTSRAQDTGRARDLLDGLPPDRRGWEWHYLHRSLAPVPKAKE